jgi:(E)-4-hydroxy-3-methylbut-2-enyl-diphosphate synthase
MADEINKFLQEKTIEWRKADHIGFEDMVVAVMGCIVNGPGESKHANIGISLPGDAEDPVCPVYVDGELAAKLKGDEKIPKFKELIEKYVKEHYSR